MGNEDIRKVFVEGNLPVGGDIIMFDDMEGQLNWVGSGIGTDWVVDRYGDVNCQFRGNYGLRMMTRATTPAADDWVIAYRAIHFRKNQVVRLVYWMRYVSDTLVRRVGNYLDYFTGTTRYMLDVAYNPSLKRWQYYNSVDVWTDVPGGAQELYGDAWHRVSLTWFPLSPRKVYLECDELSIGPLDFNVYSASSTTRRHIGVGFSVYTSSAARATVYFDDISLQEAV